MASESTRLFALLIGINHYLNESAVLRPLRGAVPDVAEFKSYLETCLTVPSEHIVVLTDNKATRAAIVKALRDLAVDGRIGKGDAILIYYAGHGTEMDPPANWEAGGPNSKIQAIIPYDFSESDHQPEVTPIPDHVLDILLSDIAEKKGNNITVILDCCHSTSGTRELEIMPSGPSNDVRVRGVTLARKHSPCLLDQRRTSHADTWFLGAVSIPTRLRRRGLDSHVLLAACSAEEKAHEEGGHGRFSAALLKLLKSVSPDKLQYSDILRHPNLDRIRDQNPHCEGLHKDRVLFNAKVVPAQRNTFPVHYVQKETDKQVSGQYIVDGGEIHNLVQGTEFSVFRKSDITCSNKIGVLFADKVDAFTLIAKLPSGAPIFDTAIPTIAMQTNSGKQVYPCIHIPPDDGFHGILNRLWKGHSLRRLFDHHIPLTGESRDAHAKIKMTGENKVEITILDRTHGLISQKLSPLVATFDPDPDDLASFLSSVAHFYREVKFINKNPHLSHSIAVEFYELGMVSEMTRGGEREERLQPVGPNLSSGGTISLVLPHAESEWERKVYGMKIINNSNQDLDVNVYRFNNGDLSISPCAESCASQSYRPSILPLKHSGGSMTIGYGAAGYPPMNFKITNGLDIEVIFLKIYISTKAVNLSHLSQSSPFSSTRAITPYQPKPKATWTDIVIPMILHRYKTMSMFHNRQKSN